MKDGYFIIPHTTEYSEYYTIEHNGVMLLDEEGNELQFDYDFEAEEYLYNKNLI